MVRRNSRHLKPIDNIDPISILDELSDKYNEITERSQKVNKALRAVSESNIVNRETKRNLNHLINDNEIKTDEFKNCLHTINKKFKRNKKKLKIQCPVNESQKIGSCFQNVINNAINRTETDVNKMLYDLMDKSLQKDWHFNNKLSHLEMTKIFKNSIRYEITVQRYRQYFGRNPLQWTPSERIVVSKIYSLLSNEYDIMGHEEGRDTNKLISDNLLNNPLNKLRRFNIPSAPRGCCKAVTSKTFIQFADGE